MKVGDLVKYTGCTLISNVGIVTAIGRTGEFSCYADCSWVNPDVHVFITRLQKVKLLSYNALKVISESR